MAVRVRGNESSNPPSLCQAVFTFRDSLPLRLKNAHLAGIRHPKSRCFGATTCISRSQWRCIDLRSISIGVYVLRCEAAQKAQAQDAINQFNTGLQQQTNLTNAQNQQQANLTNFNEANTVAGTNTGITNTQNLLPLQTAQEQNQQNLNWAGTAAKANQTQGAQLNTQAQQNTTANNSAVSGLIKNAPAIADAAENIFGAFSDERIKTDKKPLSDDDVDELMHKLTGYKYKYKKGSAADDGGKTHYGVMAQDLEKTPLKGSVVDTDKGKIVTDNDSKQNAILAVLAHLVDKSKGE